MSNYEQRIKDFADGKTLVRLSRPVRDRADSSCDACGSTEPRTLYGLREHETGRFYFVGSNCLKELVRRHVILRRFGRTSAQEAYEEEMALRAQENGSEAIPGDVDATTSRSDARQGHSDGPRQPVATTPADIVIESPESGFAQAFVATLRGVIWPRGYSLESEERVVWRRVGDAMLLERVREIQPEAVHAALAIAWQAASSQPRPLGERQSLALADDGANKGGSPSEPTVLRLQVVNSQLEAFDPASGHLYRDSAALPEMDPTHS